MKALFSIWTKPGEDPNLGFNNLKDLQASFMLAVLKAQQWYEVHVVCDKDSEKWIKALHLPIASIKVVEFEAYGVNLWNMSKLVACKVTEPPFIHIDNDVFLHQPLPKFKDYLFQNIEYFEFNGYGHHFYKDSIKYVLNNCKNYLPRFTKAFTPTAVNCGIIGVMHPRLIEEWIDQTLNMLSYKEIKAVVNADHKEFLEIVFEQNFAKWSADYYKREVALLLSPDHKEASSKGYTHLIASYKRVPEVMAKVYNHLEKNYLNYYKILQHGN